MWLCSSETQVKKVSLTTNTRRISGRRVSADKNTQYILRAVQFCGIILLDCFVPRNDGGVLLQSLRDMRHSGEPDGYNFAIRINGGHSPSLRGTKQSRLTSQCYAEHSIHGKKHTMYFPYTVHPCSPDCLISCNDANTPRHRERIEATRREFSLPANN
jgi:hypothetical protein